MTDEEKKEFEEFLQWKAEKKKKEQEQQEDKSSTSNETVPAVNEKDENPTQNDTKEVTNTDGKKTDPTVAIIAIAAIAILIIIIVALSNSNSNNTASSSIQDSTYVEETSTPTAEEIQKQKEEAAAKAEQDSIEEAKRIETIKKTIHITKVRLSSPNSAGGVSATFLFKNISGKTIKYLDWTGYPINGVGDQVTCDIRGYSDYTGRVTGPIKPGRSNSDSYYWDCAWYNNTAKKLILTGVDIEYMDGTKIHIAEDELKYIR